MNLKLFMKEVLTIAPFVTVVRLFESVHRFKTLPFRHHATPVSHRPQSARQPRAAKSIPLRAAVPRVFLITSRRPRLF
jgi:hypothetical protein